MVDRVYLHVGLPKTATSYLQTIIWSQRDLLRERGLVVPGSERRDHLWASRAVRGDLRAGAPEQHRTAWSRLCAELDDAPGTGLLSHEFFAAASAEQARAAVAALPTPEVHLVVTAREPLGLFAASWQESLKNGATTPMADYARTVSSRPGAVWNWRTLDLRLVLERWEQAVPPERTHVIVLDPGAAREDVWHRFGRVVGLDTDGVDVSGSFPNSSMGVAEAETLRRVNGALDGFGTAFDRGVWIRTFLADERLVPRQGDRFWPDPDQVAECRERGAAAIVHLASRPYDVVGDVEHLRVPAHLEQRRLTSSVTEAEVAEVAVDLAATLLGDVRAATRRPRAAPGPASAPDPGVARGLVRRAAARARSRAGAWRRRLDRGR